MSHHGTTSLLVQVKKESSPTRSGSSIRTAELSQLATVTTASYEIQLGHSSTLWKAYQVYFPIDPTSPSYHLESAAIVVLQQRPFLSTGAATTIFGQWAMYHVSSIRDASCGWRTTQALLWSSSHLHVCF